MMTTTPTMDKQQEFIEIPPLPHAITLIMVSIIYHIASILFCCSIDIVGIPLTVFFLIAIMVIGFYFVAAVVAIVIPLWTVYHIRRRVKHWIHIYKQECQQHVQIGYHKIKLPRKCKLKWMLFIILLSANFSSTTAPLQSSTTPSNNTTISDLTRSFYLCSLVVERLIKPRRICS